MDEDSNERADENPPPVKKKRGRYKTYLDPSNPFVVPRTTLQSWAAREKEGNLADRDELVNDEAVENLHEHQAGHEDLHLDIETSVADETVFQNINRADNIELEDDSESVEVMQVERQEDIRSDQPHCLCACTCAECLITTRPFEETSETGVIVPLNIAKKTYVEKYNLNEVLHPSLLTTKFEAMLMVLHFAIRHGMTRQLIEDLLSFVNKLVGSSVLKDSYYIFSKVFPPSTAVNIHYFCDSCGTYLGEKKSLPNTTTVICEHCENSCNIEGTGGENYFITLPLRHQIQFRLNNSNVKIIPHLNRSRDAIRDVMDGEVYRKLCEPGKPLANENAISITFNTDGASIFKSSSSKSSLWPIQYYINEVDPSERFRSDNMLLAGLYCGKKTPDMSMFLKPYAEELRDLVENGVTHELGNGESIIRPVVLVHSSLDSMAKPKVQCMKIFSGVCSCGYCYHPNPRVPEDNNRHHYLTTETYPLRTPEEMKIDMAKADALQQQGLLKKSKKKNEETDNAINGLKGFSVCLLIPFFNIVWGFVIDYLHCICEGVFPALFDLLLTTTHPADKNMKVLSSTDRNILDNRLTCIHPPQNMSRHPRSTRDMAKWKAREWRALLLYYILPCTVDLLPKKYFCHLKLLVEGVYILLQDSISDVMLQMADEFLQKFVTDFSKLFGVKNVTYNLHLVTHLVHSVYQSGPLWATSNFPFEAGNGRLVKLFKGTTGVLLQIANKVVIVQSVSKLFKDNNVRADVMDFCGNVLSYKYLSIKDSIGGVLCVGSPIQSLISEEEKNLFSSLNLFEGEKFFSYYKRVMHKGDLYYSRAYTKPTVHDDSCVKLSNNDYAVLHKIFQSPSDNSLLAIIKPIRIAPPTEHLARHIKTCVQDLFAPMKIVNFSESVVRKCVRVTVDGTKNYICEMPNTYEKD